MQSNSTKRRGNRYRVPRIPRCLCIVQFSYKITEGLTNSGLSSYVGQCLLIPSTWPKNRLSRRVLARLFATRQVSEKPTYRPCALGFNKRVAIYHSSRVMKAQIIAHGVLIRYCMTPLKSMEAEGR